MTTTSPHEETIASQSPPLAPTPPPRLTPRLADWQRRLLRDPATVHALLRRYGSPVHLHRTEPFLDNAEALRRAAELSGVDLQVFFARKANKALAYVDAAIDHSLGLDVASEEELRQSLERGAAPERIVVTAAVKSRELLETAVAHGVFVVLDNPSEIAALAAVAARPGRDAQAARRVSGFEVEGRKLRSRFGIDLDDVGSVIGRFGADADSDAHGPAIRLAGLHFHLDGYDAGLRVAALDHCIELADTLRDAGHALRFLDMGGGFPVSYLESAEEWRTFQEELDQSLAGRREPITYRNHGFGRLLHGTQVVGRLAAYPHHQEPTGPRWLRSILDAPRSSGSRSGSGSGSGSGGTIGRALASRSLRLFAEPGRFLMDGCGLTAARIAYRKPLASGETVLGVEMNSSNCRSRKSELLADPFLLPASADGAEREPLEAYLVGSYCTEDDLIMHRRLVFPHGAEAGDALLFPNTAGYLMHFVETRSHQFPLPRNVVLGRNGDTPRLDRIDAPAVLGETEG